MLYKHDTLYENDNKAKCKTDANLAKVMAKRGAKEKEVSVNVGMSKNNNVTKQNNTSPETKNSELHIEALVVLDHTMVTYHKEFNIENYVLTVFNMVCIINLHI